MIKQLSYWKYQKILFLILGSALFVLVAYRAYILSFTYDESGTYLFYRNNSLWDLFFEEKVWTSANNHILNTLLYQVSIGLFGHSDFTLRLPNVLAFGAMFLLCVYYLLPHFNSFWARAVILIVLFLNPYALDFYSLCRGYGLSMFFHFTALSCFWIYIKYQKTSSIYWGFAMLLLASLSLLTNLVLLPVCTLALWLVCYKEKKNRKHLFAAPIIFSVISGLLLIKPIIFLSRYKEFDFGVANLWLSFESFVGKSLRFQTYIGGNTIAILTVAFIVLLLILFYKASRNKQMMFFGLSFALLIASLFAAFIILDIQFPSERKTIIFIPFLALLLGGLINESKITRLKQGILSILAVLVCFHFVKIMELDSTIEWFYDKDTKKFAALIQEKSKGEEYLVQSDWLFQSTLNYYQETNNMKNIRFAPVTKDFEVNGIPDAIICTKDQIKPFENYASPFPDQHISIFFKK